MVLAILGLANPVSEVLVNKYLDNGIIKSFPIHSQVIGELSSYACTIGI